MATVRAREKYNATPEGFSIVLGAQKEAVVCPGHCGLWGAVAFVGQAHKKKVSDPFLMSQHPWMGPVLLCPQPTRVAATDVPKTKRGWGGGGGSCVCVYGGCCAWGTARARRHTSGPLQRQALWRWHAGATPDQDHLCLFIHRPRRHNERGRAAQRSGGKLDIQRHMSAEGLSDAEACLFPQVSDEGPSLQRARVTRGARDALKSQTCNRSDYVFSGTMHKIRKWDHCRKTKRNGTRQR